MNLTEKFIADAIRIDSGAEIMYGNDQMYDTYPVTFPTVEFQLIATDALVEVADRIRMEKGYLPMHSRDGSDNVDNDGWYDFYIGISRLLYEGSEVQLDSSIMFVVVNSDSDDNEDSCDIDLNDYEREQVLRILNQQCLKYEGKDCAALLDEAEKEMMQHEGYQA